MKRQYTTKSGVVKTYNYAKDQKTNAQQKREYLRNFIDEHQEQLRLYSRKSDKIKYVQNNIDPSQYTFSYTTISKLV